MRNADTEEPDPLPRHIAIIMDGNGRWAKARGKPRRDGHKEGAEALRRVVTACGELGIDFLTVYAFSMENWQRPKAEIAYLMSLIASYLRSETNVFVEKGISFDVIGEIERFSRSLQKQIAASAEKTAGGKDLRLTVALGYGSRQEIVTAAARLAEKASGCGGGGFVVDREAFERELYTRDLPPVDLLIRTGGEMRLSNFLMYQSAYAELYFTETYWPDFGKEELLKALNEFAGRERRFGTIREGEASA
ncbi:MAG: di-trans,poly-cis-decaprenylcistransferase [Planctomycetes bacterium]|nr:di-trans,poly-cis-decaprenylcistransferase [Planctomycetota bacterium]